MCGGLDRLIAAVNLLRVYPPIGDFGVVLAVLNDVTGFIIES